MTQSTWCTKIKSSASKASCLCNGNRIASKGNFFTVAVLLSCKWQKTQDIDIFCPWAQGPSDWLPALSFRVLVLRCQRVLPWAPFFFHTGHQQCCQLPEPPPVFGSASITVAWGKLTGKSCPPLLGSPMLCWLPCEALFGTSRSWRVLVLPHIQAMSLFQLEKKCGSIKLTFVKGRLWMWLGSFFSFRTPFFKYGLGIDPLATAGTCQNAIDTDLQVKKWGAPGNEVPHLQFEHSLGMAQLEDQHHPISDSKARKSVPTPECQERGFAFPWAYFISNANLLFPHKA